MALRLKNRVRETTTTTGTGTITVSGTASTGFQTFASALADGDTTYYQITDGTNWEIGLGTWDETAGTIARTSIFESSNSNNAVSWGSGSKDVFIVMPAEKVSGTTSYGATSDLPLTANQVGDQAFVTANNKLYIWSGSGWYAIATVNLTPTVSGNEVTYQLAQDGTPTTVTLTGTDPEGFPLTWSATESGDTGIATTTNVDNVFTITPVTDGDGGTMTVTFAASDGSNTATASSTFTLAFVSALWPDVTLSIGTSSTNSLGNEIFIDRSSNAQTVTVTNDPAQTAFHPYLNSWGVKFESMLSRVSSGSDADFGIGTNDFSYEGWFYINSLTGFTTYSSGFGLGANTANANTLRLILRDTGAGNAIVGYFVTTRVLVSSTIFETGQWNHIAICRSGSTMSMFYNGTRIATATYTTDINSGNATNAYVGHTGTNTEGFLGRVSNVRFVNGSSAYDATSTSITVPTEPLTAIANTKLLTCQSNRFIDNSPSAHAMGVSYDPKISAFNPFGQDSEYAVGDNNGSVYLATGDEVVIAHDSSISAGTGDFCLQFWVYASSSDNSGYKGLIAKYSGGAGGIWFQPNNGVLVVGFGTGILGTGTKNVMDNGWHHIAWTRSGSANKVFVDGEQELSFTASDNLNNTADMLIGDMGSLSRNFQGYVADLKYDVGNATYTSAFTPPTAPVGNTNANLYLPMDNAGVFDKTGNATLLVPSQAAGGAPLTDTSIKKFADSSINFGTTSDDKLWQVNGVPPLGSGPFTIEGWIYPTNVTGTWQSVITRDYGGTGGFRLYKTASAAEFTWYRSSSSTLTTDESTTPLVNNTWHHFAVCRDASDDLRIFIDGVQSGPTVANTYDYLAADPTNPLNIGSGGLGDASAYPFSGNLENIQVLVGVAKYTSNFTAPTAEQGRSNQAED